MKYIRMLLQKIHQYGLDNISAQVLPSKTDWSEYLTMAEYDILSDPMAKTVLPLVDEDIEFLKDYPEFLHRLPEKDRWYRDGEPDIPLGWLVGNPELQFGIRFDEPVFVHLSGLTGFGKSHGVRALLSGIHTYNQKNPQKKKVVIVCDRKGADYADLAKKFGWMHLHVQDSLREALEPPVGISLRIWIATISSLFCARAGLKYALGTLMSALSILFSLLNPHPSGRLIAPDFNAVLDFLKALPKKTFSRKDSYAESLIQQLETFCYSTHPTFSAFQGLDLERLIRDKQSVVITMPLMEPSWARQFLVDLLIVKVLKLRLAQFYRAKSIEVLFVIDEADDDINAEVEKLFGGLMCPESELFKKGREAGLGAVVITSSLVNVSRIIRENATMHMAFHVDDDKAASEAANTLSLPPYGELTLKHLKQGQCILKKIGSWPHAVKGTVFYVPHETISNYQYDRHPFVVAKDIFTIPAVHTFIKNVRSRKSDSKEPSPSDKQKQLHQYGLQLLKQWINSPYIPVTRLYDEKTEKIHYRVKNDIRAYMEEQKWAKFEDAQIGRRPLALMEPTELGYKILNLPKPEGNKGRGGIAHRHFAKWIKAHFEKQGLDASLEWKVPGTNHPVDVAVSSDGKYVIYEISVSSYENVISHIEYCLQCPDIKKLVIAAGTAKELKEIEKYVAESMMHLKSSMEITYENIETYMPKGD